MTPCKPSRCNGWNRRKQLTCIPRWIPAPRRSNWIWAAISASTATTPPAPSNVLLRDCLDCGRGPNDFGRPYRHYVGAAVGSGWFQYLRTVDDRRLIVPGAAYDGSPGSPKQSYGDHQSGARSSLNRQCCLPCHSECSYWVIHGVPPPALRSPRPFIPDGEFSRPISKGCPSVSRFNDLHDNTHFSPDQPGRHLAFTGTGHLFGNQANRNRLRFGQAHPTDQWSPQSPDCRRGRIVDGVHIAPRIVQSARYFRAQPAAV